MRTLLCVVVMLFLAATAPAVEYQPTPPVVAQANAWKPGQPIPEELLHTSGPPNGIPPSPYSHAHDGRPVVIADPIPVATDSLWVFDLIHNYPLLREVAFATHDDYIFQLAVEGALLSGGPNRFFGDVKALCAAHPEELSKPPVRALHRRAARPMVILVGMYTDDDQMSPEAARGVFERLAADLRAGVPEQKAIWKCQRKFSRPGGLSRVSCEGYVILAHPFLDRFSSAKDIPAPLARRLLHARTGDTFIERGRSPVYSQKMATVFYWVREAYSPGKQGKPTT